MAQGWSSKGLRMDPLLSVYARLTSSVSYIHQEQPECQRGEEISTVSALTKVNAGAGKPFAIQKYINYCQNLCVPVSTVTISPASLFFCVCLWFVVLNLVLIGIIFCSPYSIFLFEYSFTVPLERAGHFILVFH